MNEYGIIIRWFVKHIIITNWKKVSICKTEGNWVIVVTTAITIAIAISSTACKIK